MRTRIAGGFIPAALRAPGRVTTLKKKTAACDGLQVCPCCKKHCPLTAPKCGKGRKLAKKLGL